MFGYEMKKIWKRRLTWAAVLAVMLLTAYEVIPWQLWSGGGNTYVYSYYAGWFGLSQALRSNVPWLLPLLVGVCLCDIFAKDRAARVQAMAFSSREGRFPLCLAKLLAGTATALLTALLTFAAGTIPALLIFGGEWFDTPIQVATKTWWPITMGQELLIRLGLLTAFALLCGGVVMLASLMAGNSVAGLAVGLVMMIQEVLLSRYSDASWLPGNLLGSNMFHRYQLAELFGTQLNCVQLGAALYGGAAILLLAMCWLGWRRNAAGKG